LRGPSRRFPQAPCRDPDGAIFVCVAEGRKKEGTPVTDYRYFLTYSGVRMPLNLVNPLEAGELGNRNTFFRATYDAAGRVATCEKLVYGEVELSHVYAYRADGTLAHARIELGDEVTEVDCDASGAPIRA
jgi:hypothetical protein